MFVRWYFDYFRKALPAPKTILKFWNVFFFFFKFPQYLYIYLKTRETKCTIFHGFILFASFHGFFPFWSFFIVIKMDWFHTFERPSKLQKNVLKLFTLSGGWDSVLISTIGDKMQKINTFFCSKQVPKETMQFGELVTFKYDSIKNFTNESTSYLIQSLWDTPSGRMGVLPIGWMEVSPTGQMGVPPIGQMGYHTPTPRRCRQTENITFPHPSDAVGEYGNSMLGKSTYYCTVLLHCGNSHPNSDTIYHTNTTPNILLRNLDRNLVNVFHSI